MPRPTFRTYFILSLVGFFLNVYFINSGLSGFRSADQALNDQHSTDSIDICAKIIDQRLVKDFWHDVQLRSFSYDKNKILTEYQIDKYENDVLIPVIKIFNVIDQNGRLAGQTGKKWSLDFNGKWLDIGRGCHIKYDEKGNRIEYTEYIIEDGREIVDRIVKSVYNEAGKVTISKIIDGKINSIIKQDSTEFILNGDGKVAEEIRREWKNNDWLPVAKITSSFDGKGRIIEINNYDWIVSKWINRNRRIYKYDESKNINEEIVQSMMFGKFRDEEKNISYLDPNGNILKVEMQDYSPDAGWVTSMQTIFNYARVPPLDKTEKFAVKNINAVAGFKLSHNFPNPFNATTQIQYTVPYATHVSLKVYDILGREIAVLIDEIKDPGDYTVMWNGSDAASGVYFYRIDAEGFSESHKMNLVR
jgi:hypothetical protein